MHYAGDSMQDTYMAGGFHTQVFNSRVNIEVEAHEFGEWSSVLPAARGVSAWRRWPA